MLQFTMKLQLEVCSVRLSIFSFESETVGNKMHVYFIIPVFCMIPEVQFILFLFCFFLRTLEAQLEQTKYT